jgi:Sec7-like guanine-nucleotide exchange factor
VRVDLHNPRVSQKMKKNQFQEHFGAMLPGLPREYIDGVYDRIRAVELRVADEDSVSGSPAASATASTSAGSNDANDTQGKGLKGFFSRFF